MAMNTSRGDAPPLEGAGLVYAFAVTDGKASIFLPASAPPPADYLWYHVNLATEPGRQWLMRQAGLPPQLASILADRNETPETQLLGSGCLIVVEDRLKEFSGDAHQLSELRLWLEPSRLISARWRPLAATDRMRFRLEVGDAPPTASALYLDLMEEIVADTEAVGRKIRHRFDVLEDDVLDDATAGVAGELGAIRRDAIKLRRRCLPLRGLLGRLQNILPGWVKDEEGERFEPLMARIDRAIGDLQECQEQSRLLQDEFTARSAERSGRNLYILSVLSAVMLPLNLITGVFGMNVGGLPGLQEPGAFWWVMGGMLVFSVVVMWFFKWREWF